MRLAMLACCLCLLAEGGAAVAAAKFATVRIAGANHEEGEARWSDWMIRTATDRCDMPGIPRPLFPLVSEKQKKKGSPDCILNTITVKNASPRPIQCHMSVEVPNATIEPLDMADEVIFPEAEGSFSVIARMIDTPTSFVSSCRILPSQPLATLEIQPGCENRTTRVPNPDDYYPPGAIRRHEEGSVEFEYFVDPSSKRLKDVAVVSSSGFPAFDNATLKFARNVRAESSCPEQRYRMTVHFRLANR